MKKRLIFLTLLFALILYLAAAALGPRPQTLSLPIAQQQLAEMEQLLKGTSCDTFTDPNGIVHLRAEKHITLLACLGYQHGFHRGAQMDFFRKAAEGRRAEFFGRDFIRADFLMRLLGLPERAARVYQLLSEHDPDAARRLTAYSVGVNRGFQEAKDVPPKEYEFEELDYRPETWEPHHTLALLMLQSFTQTSRTFRIETERQQTAENFGDATKLFSHEKIEWDTAILKEGEYPTQKTPLPTLKPRKHSSLLKLDRFADLGSLNQGSNNWAVAPSRSKSKHAWLANDPHLDLEFPPFWFWVHLELKDQSLNAIGATLPGVPVIVSGANKHVAWGLTNSYIDVADIVSIPNQDLDSAQTFRPWIWVRVAGVKLPLFFKTFTRTSEDYPILPLDAPTGRSLALRWVGFELEAHEWVSALSLMTAQSAQDADRILSQVSVPSWNYIFADDRGAIGYRAVGKIPRRTRPHPHGFHEGRPADLKFTEFLTPEQMPHSLDPPRGYVVTANNKQWDADAAFNLGRAHHVGFRAYRIESLLFAQTKHDLESLRKIQCDTRVIDAEYFKEPIVRIVEQAEDIRSHFDFVLTTLREWDYESGPACKACAIYRRSLDWILELTDTDEYALTRILRSPNLRNEHTLTIQKAFRQALKDLGIRAKDPASIREWKDLHRASFRHFSHLPQFGAQGSIFTPGDPRTVNLGDARWNSDTRRYEHVAGASQRLIVEMSHPPKVYMRLAGPNLWDERTRDLREPAWQDWADCTLERQNFPLDWDPIEPKPLTF